jgi:hypothetical protein
MKGSSIRIVAMLILGFSARCWAQQRPQFEVFFVAVGSSWYVTPIGVGVQGFSRIPGANKSAEIIGDSLLAGGAQYGIELTSDDQKFVTVADIYKAVRQVESRMTEAKPVRPLFVFYFAGHGMSEGIAWSHFSIPGDFAYRGDPTNLDIEGVGNSTLYAGDIIDELERLREPFLVMLDSCYDGKERQVESPLLTSVATNNLKDIGGILRALNEFRNSYPVLFSTVPGKSVVTVQNPSEPDSEVTIAPLARRFILSVRSTLDKGSPVSLGQFLADMMSPRLDSLTTAAVTHSPVPDDANALFLHPNAPSQPNRSIDRWLGTGNRMQICCRPASIFGHSKPAISDHYTGKLTIAGEQGEYISSGHTLIFASPSNKVTVTQQGVGNLHIRFERGESEFDASFSTPAGERFEAREYNSAQRWNMADAGHPALEISGDGRGCGDIAGSFLVNNVGYDLDGSISKFSATFRQLCDDSKIESRGSVELSRTP